MSEASAPGIAVGGPGFRLGAFHGPLELLLHLVRTSDLDVTTVALAQVARQYNEYLDRLASPIDPNEAGEYLVMAATLMQLKSRLLLPPDPAEDGLLQAEEGAEPCPASAGGREVREAALHLQEREALMDRLFPRPPASVAEYADESGIDADLFSLLRAFQTILRRVVDDPTTRLARERVSLVERIDWILETLRRERRIGFRALFLGLPDRVSCILTFLALLEVIRLRLARAYSSHRLEDLLVVLVEGDPPAREEDSHA